MKGVLFEGIEPQENLGKDIKNIIKKTVSNSLAIQFLRIFSGKIVEMLLTNKNNPISNVLWLGFSWDSKVLSFENVCENIFFAKSCLALTE